MGRQLRADQPGVIPDDVRSVLEGMKIQVASWVSTVDRYGSLFHRVAGRVENIVASAKEAGKKWFSGLGASREAFGVMAGVG